MWRTAAKILLFAGFLWIVYSVATFDREERRRRNDPEIAAASRFRGAGHVGHAESVREAPSGGQSCEERRPGESFVEMCDRLEREQDELFERLEHQNPDEPPPMKGTPEETQAKKERYDQLIGEMRRAVLDGKDDLGKRLANEARSLVDPREEGWWYDRVDDEWGRAVLVRIGAETDFSEDPGIAQRRELRQMSPMEWVAIAGPLPVVRNGVRLDPLVLEGYLRLEVVESEEEGIFGEEETRYLIDLARSDDSMGWPVTFLRYSRHRSAWTFIAERLALTAPQVAQVGSKDDAHPETDKAHEAYQLASLLEGLSQRPEVRDPQDRIALEQAYRTLSQRLPPVTFPDPRDSILQALARITPRDEHAFFREVAQGTPQTGSDENSRYRSLSRISLAIDNLTWDDPADYALLVETVDSPKVPGPGIPLSALSSLGLGAMPPPPPTSEDFDPLRNYPSPEFQEKVQRLFRRWTDEHPMPEVRLEAAKTMIRLLRPNSLVWGDEMRRLATSARGPEVREWAAKELEPFERIWEPILRQSEENKKRIEAQQKEIDERELERKKKEDEERARRDEK